MAYINNCTVFENGADGIKYVHADERPDEKLDRNDVYDLCTFPTTTSQTFPVTISMEQNKYAPNIKRCPQVSLPLAKVILCFTRNFNDNATTLLMAITLFSTFSRGWAMS